jgi:predicted murein hydrolase (TIGR00659 family)
MTELFKSPFFGIAISVAVFAFGTFLQKKTHFALFNPLVVSVAAIIPILLLLKIPYEDYYAGGSVVEMFLVPATVCLGVSIYSKAQVLKKNWLPIAVGCSAGSLASMFCVFGLCKLFLLEESLVNSLIPKSVTAPIAMGISEANGGIVMFTMIAVMITGMTGALFSPLMIRLFRIDNPVAAGIGIGACSHAIGTARALQIGEVEGAMSALAIGICGVLTVVFSFAFYRLI